MEAREWERRLLRGHGGEWPIGSLPAYLNGLLEGKSRVVRIGHEYALKALVKHGLTAEDLLLLPAVLSDGQVINDRPRHLTFFYLEPTEQRWFQLTIKRCGTQRAHFVTTFHALGPDDVRRRLKKNPVIWPLK